jgi:diaminopimelate decarboxylase
VRYPDLQRFAPDYVAAFGSPLYVVLESVLRDSFRDVKAAFEGQGIPHSIAYSVKTNYLTEICRILREEGALAEIVSGFEWEVARHSGFCKEELVFNGPYKTPAELDELAGIARINAESLDEIEAINAIGKNREQTISLGLRVNMRIGNTAWSRFGFSLESGEFDEAVSRIAKLESVSLRGIHTHIGTNIPRPDAFREAAERLSEEALRLMENGHKIEYIDLGGGFGAEGAEPTEEVYDRWEVPPMEDFAAAIATPLRNHFSESERPLLIIEPGRAIVSRAGVLLTSVVSRKGTADRVALTVDGGINLLPSAYYMKHRIENLSRPQGPQVIADVWGPLCMHLDCLGRDVVLARPEAGDILIVYDTGAYDFCQSTQFIRLRPAVVVIQEDGTPRLVRRAEMPDDVLRLDVSSS